MKQVPASCPSPPSCFFPNPFSHPAGFSLPQLDSKCHCSVFCATSSYWKVRAIHCTYSFFVIWKFWMWYTWIYTAYHCEFVLYACVTKKRGNRKYHFQLVGLTLLRKFCACCDFIWWVSCKRCYHRVGEVAALLCVWEIVPSVIIKIFHFLKSWIERAAGWCAGEPILQ